MADIGGKPLIFWVHKQAVRVTEFDKVYVATDDDRIRSVCKDLDIACIMTSEKHKTGTDRAGEVAERIKADIYVNIQGDEPLLTPAIIRSALRPFRSGARRVEVSNLMTQIRRMTDLSNSTVPKVVCNSANELVYMSRFPVPYPKNPGIVKYYKQVCVYGLTRNALRRFCRSRRGLAETAEDIEILRFVENGIKVQMVEIEKDTVAVDTPSDLEQVKEILTGNR